MKQQYLIFRFKGRVPPEFGGPYVIAEPKRPCPICGERFHDCDREEHLAWCFADAGADYIAAVPTARDAELVCEIAATTIGPGEEIGLVAVGDHYAVITGPPGSFEIDLGTDPGEAVAAFERVLEAENPFY